MPSELADIGIVVGIALIVITVALVVLMLWGR
jgi:hypothetical protein